MLRKIGAILLAPATVTGAAIGLVCYLLTGKHPSIRLLMLLGFLSGGAVVVGVSVLLIGAYNEYNSPWEQCIRIAQEQGTVCKLTYSFTAPKRP